MEQKESFFGYTIFMAQNGFAQRGKPHGHPRQAGAYGDSLGDVQEGCLEIRQGL
jgi:hypothetical protein